MMEAQGFKTERLWNYNHNLFMLGFLLPRGVQDCVTRWRGKLLWYVGRR